MHWPAVLLAPLLAACVAAAPAPPTTYDFGLSVPPIAIAAPLPGALAIATVSAPASLLGDGIIYRLAYDNAARPQIYSQSRWSAAPTELLRERLQQRLAGVATGGLIDDASPVAADYRLQLHLEEFGQVFTARDRAHAVVRIRASLIDPQRGDLVAQQSFAAERPAAPDAAGAARGLREASDTVLDRLAAWLIGQLGPTS